jgi:hypothetical protein
LLLIALSLAILALCGYIGYRLVSIRVSIFTVVVGIILIAFGFMFFLFLVRFIFSKHKEENPYRIRVFKEDHPELFKLIEEVADEVGTHVPRKVFLVQHVNATVFYNSNFWSLFVPVRKNLDIGLGLINSLSLSELPGYRPGFDKLLKPF